jgi:allantoinase
MTSDTGRYSYLSLVRRPKITWPNGARVAFWVVPNIEFYELLPPRNEGKSVWWRPDPDILNYGQRDYGNRVGVWRMAEVMQRCGVRGTVSLSAALCDHIPEVIEHCVGLNWEFLSHGVYNTRLIYGLSDDQIRRLIADSLETIAAATGASPKGWLSPALSGTMSVFDILPDVGITYTLDLLHDDQPLPVRVKKGALISLPYSSEMNDVQLLNVRGLSPRRYFECVKRQFDQLYKEGADNGMVMCLPVHPYLVGHPHRIGAFQDALEYITSHEDVWITTGNEIAEWYYANHYETALALVEHAQPQACQ